MVGIITMNNPESLNALSNELMADVSAALQDFTHDPSVRAIVLNGEGRAFCSGFNLKAPVAAPTVDTWREELEYGFNFIMQFWDCPKPTIAAVRGAAVAGGFELALACDITVAADDARLGEPEVRFGSAIVALLLPWLIPAKISREILLTGDDRIDVQRALQLGIINHVVPAGKELDKAVDLGYRIGGCAENSVQMLKRSINRTYEIMSMRQALLSGLDTAVMVFSSGSPERSEFNRIRREEGLKAALAWREKQGLRPPSAS
jgi:enoyl-CoA hydratase